MDRDSASTPNGLRSTRRAFLTRVVSAAAATNIIGLNGTTQPSAQAVDVVEKGNRRREEAYKLRHHTAQARKKLKPLTHRDNGDEDLYENRIGNFTKGLPHNQLGEVDSRSYKILLHALASGKPAHFEAIPMGSPDPRKFVSPQAGLTFDLEGGDSHAFNIPPAPAFGSAELAGEILENYWMALLRDIPFHHYSSSHLALAAAADLSSVADFRGPKQGGVVTPQTLFRGLTPGDVAGPYISQFLLKPAPFGANFIEQRLRTAVTGVDYMTSYDDWLNCQRGAKPAVSEQFDSARCYIHNGRNLSSWVHIDVLYQAYFHALMILLHPPSLDPTAGGMGAPFDRNNPYTDSATQEGFATFGGPHIAALMPEVATRALHAVWFQKWFVHRRLRPEAYAGRIHNHITGAAQYPLVSDDLLGSPVFPYLYDLYGSYLLPQAFPEGCPMHPAYGAGHATVAGACVTILKAFFDESFVIENPVQTTDDGLDLVPYTGNDLLTVGGELNKLASNVALGRNIAGVHWRSDGTESLKLGEAVAISILEDQKATYNENFAGFSLTKFDGTTIHI